MNWSAFLTACQLSIYVNKLFSRSMYQEGNIWVIFATVRTSKLLNLLK